MSGIRVNQAKNFKGEPYATEKFVRDMVQLPEGVDNLIDPDTGKLAAELNPGITIQLKGEDVEQNATKINFIGNCMVVTNGEGFVTARIGDNLNSSNFNSQDGQTNGLVTRSISGTGTTSATPATDFATNVGTTLCWKKGTNTVTIKPNELIHFDNNTGTTFEVDLITGKEGSQTTKTIYFGPVTGNATLTGHEGSADGTEFSGISLAISSFEPEAKTAEGATGYQGMVTITANMQTILSENADFKFVVRHVNGVEGTKAWNTDTYIFFVNDATTKPAIASATFSVSGGSVVQLSGVKALKGGSVSVTATGITNLANPAAVNNKVLVRAMNANTTNNWFNNFSSSGNTGFTGFTGASTDVATFTGTQNLRGTGLFPTANVQVSAQNINGYGTAIDGTETKNLFLLNESKNNPGTNAEYFLTETDPNYPRKKNDCTTNWDSSWSLASGDGAEGLMFLNGTLVYPNGNYTGSNDGINSIVGADQPDYSALTGDRSYVRWFAKTGSLAGGKFVIYHKTKIESFVNAGTLNFEVSKDGTQWYDIARLSGIGTAFSWGETYSSMTFVFTDGVATNGMWFRVRMASSSVTAVIKQIVME